MGATEGSVSVLCPGTAGRTHLPPHPCWPWPWTCCAEVWITAAAVWFLQHAHPSPGEKPAWESAESQRGLERAYTMDACPVQWAPQEKPMSYRARVEARR